PLLHAHFWVHVPKNDKQEEVEAPPSDPGEGPIVISVNAKGHIQLNRDVYPDADFPVRLRRMLVARGARKVFFDAHDDAPYARAVEGVDRARRAGAAHSAGTPEGLRCAPPNRTHPPEHEQERTAGPTSRALLAELRRRLGRAPGDRPRPR